MSSLQPQPLSAPPPVFNCVVYLAPADSAGITVARVVNLSGIEGRGRTEREALAQAVTAFKTRLAAYLASGEPIPWLTPPAPATGQTERLIAVHL